MIIIFFRVSAPTAGTYTNSAHGNSSYGVDRTSTTMYTKGHCAHCHEQHASINGDEPAPSIPSGPDNYLLFGDNHTSQTNNFCLDCHSGSSHQVGGVFYNRTYSYRAGGWTVGTVGVDDFDDVAEAFDSTSAHNLWDIVTFLSTNAPSTWGYNAYSNPCAGCHNPHTVLGDPANNGSGTKSSVTRGWPVSRPSEHADLYTWNIWGDQQASETERMSDYAGALTYQPPYRYYTTAPSALEPQGDPTGSPLVAAQNTTDYVTFCADCHNAATLPYSTALLRTLNAINWDTSAHGRLDGLFRSDTLERKAPYNAANLNYVLACTDCHEPHGSPNYGFLIRKEVNGGTTGVASDTQPAWLTLCDKCHTQDHTKTGDPCTSCHYHGAPDKMGKAMF